MQRIRSSAPGTWEQEQQSTQRYLMLLATGIHELAADIAALGPDGYDEAAGSAGPPLGERLEDLLIELEEFSARCGAVRRRAVERQLSALGIDRATASQLRLHLGSGAHAIEGWINIDVYPAQFVHNINRGLPFRDDCAQYVFLSHVLEHLYYPSEALALAREIRRVLAPGGVVRIAVPDIEACVVAYAERRDQFFEDRAKTWTWWSRDMTRLASFLTYAGASAHPSQFLTSHKFGYDFETLAQLLTTAGFDGVERSTFMGSRHGALRVDEASTVAGAHSNEIPYSLFVEAAAPSC